MSARPLLVLVTDRHRLAGGSPEALTTAVNAAVTAGVDIVQLRERDLPRPDQVALARQIVDAIRGRARLLLNGDPRDACDAGADGVHLPETAPPVAEVRAAFGRDGCIFAAVHSLESALRREAEGADALVLGTVFRTASKPGVATIGLEGVERVCAAVRVPVIAIGGITAANALTVLEAGAAGIAVVGAIFDDPAPAAAAAALRAAVDGAPAPDAASPP